MTDHQALEGPVPPDIEQSSGNSDNSASDLPNERIHKLTPAQLRKLRERFISDPNATDLSGLRPVVERSWRRSLRWNVDPFRGDFAAVQQPKLDELVRRCAEPVIADLERLAADTGSGIFLSDPYGTIADFRGDADLRRVAERVFPTFGAAMSEDIVGTNAEGTALEEGRSVQIWGPEHFAIGLEDFCCTAVPIRDPLRGSLRGFLSLTLPENIGRDVDPRTISLIVEGASAEITRSLAENLAIREKTLLDTYLSEVRKRGGDSVVVMDDRTTIATRAAMEMLKQNDYAVLAGYARESEKSHRTVDRAVVLGPGRTLHLNARPISSAGETIGSVIRLKPADRAPSRLAGGLTLRADPFSEVVGESLILRRTAELAHTAVSRRMPAHITGESGTGKLMLASAMASKMSNDVMVLDGAHEHAHPNGLTNDFEAAINSGSAVVLQHVDALSSDSKDAIIEVIASQANLPVVFTSARLDEGTAELVRALSGVEIEVPPLRKRRDDIPRLALHFLKASSHGVLRISPPLVRALAEADWPGNVAQLRDFVNIAAMRCASPELGMDHLTDSQRKGLEGSRLSRLEEVELQQIREALAEAEGNRVRAAELLQIGRSTLYRKVDSYTRRGFVIKG